MVGVVDGAGRFVLDVVTDSGFQASSQRVSSPPRPGPLPGRQGSPPSVCSQPVACVEHAGVVVVCDDVGGVSVYTAPEAFSSRASPFSISPLGSSASTGATPNCDGRRQRTLFANQPPTWRLEARWPRVTKSPVSALAACPSRGALIVLVDGTPRVLGCSGTGNRALVDLGPVLGAPEHCVALAWCDSAGAIAVAGGERGRDLAIGSARLTPAEPAFGRAHVQDDVDDDADGAWPPRGWGAAPTLIPADLGPLHRVHGGLGGRALGLAFASADGRVLVAARRAGLTISRLPPLPWVAAAASTGGVLGSAVDPTAIVGAFTEEASPVPGWSVPRRGLGGARRPVHVASVAGGNGATVAGALGSGVLLLDSMGAVRAAVRMGETSQALCAVALTARTLLVVTPMGVEYWTAPAAMAGRALPVLDESAALELCIPGAPADGVVLATDGTALCVLWRGRSADVVTLRPVPPAQRAEIEAFAGRFDAAHALLNEAAADEAAVGGGGAATLHRVSRALSIVGGVAAFLDGDAPSGLSRLAESFPDDPRPLLVPLLLLLPRRCHPSIHSLLCASVDEMMVSARFPSGEPVQLHWTLHGRSPGHPGRQSDLEGALLSSEVALSTDGRDSLLTAALSHLIAAQSRLSAARSGGEVDVPSRERLVGLASITPYHDSLPNDSHLLTPCSSGDISDGEASGAGGSAVDADDTDAAWLVSNPEGWAVLVDTAIVLALAEAGPAGALLDICRNPRTRAHLGEAAEVLVSRGEYCSLAALYRGLGLRALELDLLRKLSIAGACDAASFSLPSPAPGSERLWGAGATEAAAISLRAHPTPCLDLIESTMAWLLDASLPLAMKALVGWGTGWFDHANVELPSSLLPPHDTVALLDRIGRGLDCTALYLDLAIAADQADPDEWGSEMLRRYLRWLVVAEAQTAPAKRSPGTLSGRPAAARRRVIALLLRKRPIANVAGLLADLPCGTVLPERGAALLGLGESCAALALVVHGLNRPDAALGMCDERAAALRGEPGSADWSRGWDDEFGLSGITTNDDNSWTPVPLPAPPPPLAWAERSAHTSMSDADCAHTALLRVLIEPLRPVPTVSALMIDESLRCHIVGADGADLTTSPRGPQARAEALARASTFLFRRGLALDPELIMTVIPGDAPLQPLANALSHLAEGVTAGVRELGLDLALARAADLGARESLATAEASGVTLGPGTLCYICGGGLVVADLSRSGGILSLPDGKRIVHGDCWKTHAEPRGTGTWELGGNGLGDD